MLVAVVGVVLVLLLVLLWVNVQLVRPRSPQTARDEGTIATAAAATSASSDKSGASIPGKPLGRDASAKSNQVAAGAVDSVEVLARAEHPKKLFERSEYPFQLYETQVAEFGAERWKRCFHQLANDARVLGWIAFQEERVGAADRAYDAGFLEVLRTYRRTVEKLKREVGMSAVHETSVVGEEGKVWFITAIDDAWLALFLDRQADPKMLADRLLEPVLVED